MKFSFRNVSFVAAFSLACTTALSMSFADEKKEEEEGPALTIGSPAPALDVEHWVSDGHGKFKPVTKFEKGKVYVVEFWATWCGPCVASMPHLAETQEKYADKGVQIVSISDEDLETVEGFLKRPLPGQEEEASDEEKKDEKAEEKKDAEEKTYGTLTSAYCLTTDPDRSVAADYMEAAGQNGIPTCFIVGKSSQIEWIGHPMAMDDPLSKVVGDKWDREAYLAEFKKQQDRDALMGKISRLMRQGKSDDALTMIAESRKKYEGDAETLQFLGQIELQILVTPAIQKIQQGEAEEGLKALDEIAKKVPAESRGRIVGLQFRVMMSLDKTDDAAKLLQTLVADKTTTSDALNEIAWQVYEAANGAEDFSKPLIAAATAAAEKAVEGSPESSMILDTLAHLHHLNGDLDKAIEVQELAVKHKNAPAAEMNAQMAEYLKELKAEKKDK
ncbi:MAG: redoxin domain-containing protein [Planctomycetaceae bacterium]|nr:redoxin domain-containing protein [Planctomycetaceae bacterium]